MFKSRFLSSSLAIAAICLSLSSNVGATVSSATSSAYGEYVDLTITPLLSAEIKTTSGPLPSVSGSAPAPYNLSTSFLSASASPFLSTGLLTVNASSNVDLLPGVRNADANATVNDLSILLSSFGIDLTANTIQSTASVTGDFGNFNAIGTTTFEGLMLNGVASLFIAPAPNTVLLSLPGLTITLNEQFTSTDGLGSSGMEVNAIHVDFDNYLSLGHGVVNGDIIVAHSEAFISAVPEPETYSMILAGLALMGAIVRRSKINGCA
jgi:hypothetical protein